MPITYLLVISDLAASVFAFFVSYYLRNFGPFRIFLDSVQPLTIYLRALPFAGILLIILFYVFGLYHPRQRISRLGEFYTAFKAISFWFLLIMAGSYLVKYDFSRLIVLLYFVFSVVSINSGRFIVRGFQKRRMRKGLGLNKILIVGAGRVGREVAKRLEQYETVGYKVMGFVDGNVKNRSRINILGDFSKLQFIIKNHGIDEVYIADPTLSHREILNTLAQIGNRYVKFKVVSNIFELASGRVDIHDIEKIPSLDLKYVSPTPLYSFIKRGLDIIFSCFLLLITFPFWVLVVVFIKFDSPGPTILKQVRVGFKEKPFNMYKFRTMYNDVTQKDDPPYDIKDPRVTRIGRLLRRTSLDELPQLINILKGEMSLVGPRPELPSRIEFYDNWQRQRFEVKPGLTGLWQVLGRKDLPLRENIEYDFYYINNQSLFLDFVIILKTIPVVILGRGAY